MRENVTISHRGASYELGRGQHCYGIWAIGSPGPAPLQWWPETADGWSGAWLRFSQLEPAAAGLIAPAALAQAPGTTQAPAARPVSSLMAAALLGIGVVLGIAGLFPGYLGTTGLTGTPAQLVPHLIYLAGWTASAILILLGGTRRWAGAMLGAGVSAVTFGILLADIGSAVSGLASTGGAGLVLASFGWLACAAGSAVALSTRRGTWHSSLRGRPYPRALQAAPVITLILAGIGAVVAFAPSWDRYTLHSPAGVIASVTVGNAFANPAPVIIGDVAVMVAVLTVAVLAAIWRPNRMGAALLGGAIIPLAAQAIMALIQIGQKISPAQFGIAPGQAALAGISVSSALTLAFWVYCAFLIALALSCAQLASGPDSAAQQPAAPATWPAPAPAPAEDVTAPAAT